MKELKWGKRYLPFILLPDTSECNTYILRLAGFPPLSCTIQLLFFFVLKTEGVGERKQK